MARADERAIATAMMPIGPAPVISTSSPTMSKASAVCAALPNGSRIEAMSSRMASGSLNALTAGIDEVFGERALAVDADADRVAAQMPAAGAAVAAVAAGDVAFAGDAVADLEAAHFAADSTISPKYSWPTAIGTGMVFCAHSSQL